MRNECVDWGQRIIAAGALADKGYWAAGEANWGNALYRYAQAAHDLKVLAEEKVVTEDEFAQLLGKMQQAEGLCYRLLTEAKAMTFRDVDIVAAPALGLYKLALEKACACELSQVSPPPPRPPPEIRPIIEER